MRVCIEILVKYSMSLTVGSLYNHVYACVQHARSVGHVTQITLLPLITLTGHIQDPMPLIEKSRASCPGGRFPSFIYQVIIITGLNKLYDCMLSP